MGNRRIRQARHCPLLSVAFRQRNTLPFRIIVNTRVVGFGGQILFKSNSFPNRSSFTSEIDCHEDLMFQPVTKSVPSQSAMQSPTRLLRSLWLSPFLLPVDVVNCDCPPSIRPALACVPPSHIPQPWRCRVWTKTFAVSRVMPKVLVTHA